MLREYHLYASAICAVLRRQNSHHRHHPLEPCPHPLIGSRLAAFAIRLALGSSFLILSPAFAVLRLGFRRLHFEVAACEGQKEACVERIALCRVVSFDIMEFAVLGEINGPGWTSWWVRLSYIDRAGWFVGLSVPFVPSFSSHHHGRDWYVVLVDDVHKTVLTVVFVARSMLMRFRPSVGAFGRWRFRCVLLTDDHLGVPFHFDEVVRSSDGVLERRGWDLV